MAYSTANPPAMLADQSDGSTPRLWVYTSTDDPATVAGSGYFSNGGNVGMRTGDAVIIRESDNAYAPVIASVASVTAGAATVSLDAGGGDALVTEAGTGITAGTGTVYRSSVRRSGTMVVTEILVDLTGLNSQATDLDIIGVDGTANPCHFGQITAAQNGTIFGGTMRCMEVPAGGDPNVALYSATEGTGVEDGLVSSLTETLLFDPNADWTIDMDRSLTGVPAADEYLYLVQGDATGTNATYTAGKFLITLYGY